MAAITAAMVKELREMTGAGMMDCKKALSEADGNMEAAVDILKKSGAAKMLTPRLTLLQRTKYSRSSDRKLLTRHLLPD